MSAPPSVSRHSMTTKPERSSSVPDRVDRPSHCSVGGLDIPDDSSSQQSDGTGRLLESADLYDTSVHEDPNAGEAQSSTEMKQHAGFETDDEDRYMKDVRRFYNDAKFIGQGEHKAADEEHWEAHKTEMLNSLIALHKQSKLYKRETHPEWRRSIKTSESNRHASKWWSSAFWNAEALARLHAQAAKVAYRWKQCADGRRTCIEPTCEMHMSEDLRSALATYWDVCCRRPIMQYVAWTYAAGNIKGFEKPFSILPDPLQVALNRQAFNRDP
jgi:hypothetical protein